MIKLVQLNGKLGYISFLNSVKCWFSEGQKRSEDLYIFLYGTMKGEQIFALTLPNNFRF